MSRAYSSLRSNQHFGGAIDDLGAARSRHQPPLAKACLAAATAASTSALAGFLKDADHVAGVGGIEVFEGLAGRGLDPFAVDEVLENLGRLRSLRWRGGQGIGCHSFSRSLSAVSEMNALILDATAWLRRCGKEGLVDCSTSSQVRGRNSRIRHRILVSTFERLRYLGIVQNWLTFFPQFCLCYVVLYRIFTVV